ncbi:hypothetical protein GE21DRAFT_1073469 [Neurospora crassa]|nr:hypothetical protein GE21DRAFT_1073469 [Neurospora crassa]
MVMDVVVVLGLEAEDILLKIQLDERGVQKVQLRLDRGLGNKGREEDGWAQSRSRGEDWVFIYGGGVSWRDRVISLILPCPCPDGPPVSPCDLGGGASVTSWKPLPPAHFPGICGPCTPLTHAERTKEAGQWPRFLFPRSMSTRCGSWGSGPFPFRLSHEGRGRDLESIDASLCGCR